MIFKNASQESGKSSNIFGSGMSSSTSDGNNRLGNIFSSSLSTSSNPPSGQSSDAASSNIFGKQAPQESGELAKSSLWSSAPTDLSENPFKVPNIASGNIDLIIFKITVTFNQICFFTVTIDVDYNHLLIFVGFVARNPLDDDADPEDQSRGRSSLFQPSKLKRSWTSENISAAGDHGG